MKLSKEKRSRGAKKGSQFHLQDLINKNSGLLDQAIFEAAPTLKSAISGNIKWVSPLEKDNYLEYQDGEFLEAVGYPLLGKDLLEFWPEGGPVWDALGVVSLKTANGVIILEAKSHIKELESNGCGAGGKSKEIIMRTFEKVRSNLGVSEDADWLGKYYQYANRLAHLYFLLITQKIPTWLVFLYFVNDLEQDGPISKEGWDKTLKVIKQILGLPQRHILSNNIVSVFYDLKS